MTKAAIVFSLFRTDKLAEELAQTLGLEIGSLVLHQFPDKETVVTINSSVNDRDLLVLTDLSDPNAKGLPLLYFADTAKALGAKKITLIAPYLPYMRQDKQFHPGEGITSRYFAKLLSSYFDALITIDPHLHRWHSLDEIYSIPSTLLHATQLIARWISTNIKMPLLIGPDAESLQWVKEIACFTKAPYLILEKTRRGDKQVEVTIPDLDLYEHHQPVLVDDIISTARTMIETVNHLKELKKPAPVCIAVHALFADAAYQDLQKAGAAAIITTNTIEHPSNQINVLKLLAESILDN